MTKRGLQIRPQAENANAHSQRGMRELEASIERDGLADPITVAADDESISGSGRIEIMGRSWDLLHADPLVVRAPADRPIVIESDGTTPIIHRRVDLPSATDPRAQRLSVASNKVAADNLVWDGAALERMRANGADLDTLFTADEWAAAVGQVEVAPGGGGDDFDTTPEDGPTRTQPGDLWIIGGVHRLIVGDCTDPVVVERLMGGGRPILMVTDPPYGVEYDPTWRKEAGINKSHGMMGKVENDARIDWREAYDVSGAQIAYVWHAGRHARRTAENLDDAGYDVVAQIIWVKDRFALSRGDYHWQHEPCWYAVAKGKSHNWQGARNQSTVWEIARLSSNKDDSEEDVWGHGTQKPMECMQRPIENNTVQGQLAYDPFLGTGTTLIAAHRTGRRCYGCEISPRYADVILRRAEAEGLTVERATSV